MSQISRYTAGDRDGTGGIRPDFVLLGIPVPGGVELWASTKLSYAELEAEVKLREPAFEELIGRIDYPVFPEPPVYTLRAGLRRFVVVRAGTYREALALLLSEPGWEPGGGQLPAIGPPR